MIRLAALASLLLSTAQMSRAEAPNIVVDIAPVHSLVSMVTEGITDPSLLIEPSATPHTNAMRPSVAAALQDADVVFWIGPDLTPWLEDPIETLAPDAVHSALLSAPGTQALRFRASDTFDDHAEKEGDHDDHAKDEDEHEAHGDEHGHEGAEHDEHGDEEHADDDHAHDHSGADPHAWLSPQNAQAWLTHIANTLSEHDPDNAATYAANAAAGRDAIAVEIDAAQAQLAPLADHPFVVFHDAYHYFEEQFGLETIGALSLSDAVPPSPSHVADIQAVIRDEGVVCVFAEPQFSDGLVRTVVDGTDAKTAQLDPLGAKLTLGPDFYPALIRDMASRFANCLQ